MKFVYVALLSLCGCFGTDFDPPSIVKTWRVLAMFVDKPEAAPGEDVQVTAMLIDPEGRRVTSLADRGLVYRYTGCVQAEDDGFVGGTFDPVDPGAACGRGIALPLASDDMGRATVPGEATATLLARLTALGAVYGDVIPLETLERVGQDVGLPLTVQLDVLSSDGEVLVQAVKRFVLVGRDMRGSNPPPPRMQIGDDWVSARGDDPLVCAPESGEVPHVAANERVLLAPDEDDEMQRDTYYVLDLRGQIVEAQEGAYYSFFSTDGEFEESVTSAPARENFWTAPDEPGEYPLFLIARDGHAGISGCEARVVVE